jgi:hypothetical protein
LWVSWALLVFVALGLVLLVAGLVGFFYPKPPPLDFTAFLGGHTRLHASLICIVLGGALALVTGAAMPLSFSPSAAIILPRHLLLCMLAFLLLDLEDVLGWRLQDLLQSDEAT